MKQYNDPRGTQAIYTTRNMVSTKHMHLFINISKRKLFLVRIQNYRKKSEFSSMNEKKGFMSMLFIDTK